MAISFHKNSLVDTVLRKRAEDPDYLRGETRTYYCHPSVPQFSHLKTENSRAYVIGCCQQQDHIDIRSEHKVLVSYHDHHYYHHHLIQFFQNPSKTGPICILFYK